MLSGSKRKNLATKSWIRISLLLVFAFTSHLTVGCSSVRKSEDKVQSVVGPTDDISIMTYNVENLFDTRHDAGKDDYAFLPLSLKQSKSHKDFCSKIVVQKWKDECLLKDWTEDKLKEKMRRLAETVLMAQAGKGPDVLILQEVENLAVLKRWNKEFLKGFYREVILIEGADKRGIDVAILSKLPLNRKPVLHTIPFKFDDPKRAEDTRGVLEAELQLPDGQTMMVLAVHLPNPAHPKELRNQAFEFLNSLAKSYGESRYVVIAGDVNVTAEEDAELKRTVELSKSWLISHQVGCKSCKGTYFYPPKSDWSFLDWMMFSKNFESNPTGWQLDKTSIQIWNANPKQVDENGYPASFEGPESAIGVADLFPILAVIRKMKRP